MTDHDDLTTEFLQTSAARDDVCLIWSNEHGAWWGPGRRGYVARIEHAGLYTHAEALRICFEAMPGRRGSEPLREIPVRVQDVRFLLERFTGTYPHVDPQPKEDA